MTTRTIRATLMSALCAISASAWAADIAVIDRADQWTLIRGLTQSLDTLKIPYDDITADAEKGTLKLGGQKMLFLSSMYTNNPALHTTLDNNADMARAFVRNGGVIIEPTQADQNEANVDWLPAELSCVRSDPDHPEFVIKAPKHPLFNTPNKLTDDDFKAWGHQGWPTVWESINSHKGFEILAETAQGKAAILEATYGSGKFVMMCIAPDKYATKGNDANTMAKAMLVMENIVAAYLPKPVSPRGRLASAWAELKR